eukprot:1954383-Pyramimonas_sp.AAC.1
MTSVQGGIRAQQITVLRGPTPCPMRPTVAMCDDVDDHDGEPQFTAARGEPSPSPGTLMETDADQRIGRA